MADEHDPDARPPDPDRPAHAAPVDGQPAPVSLETAPPAPTPPGTPRPSTPAEPVAAGDDAAEPDAGRRAATGETFWQRRKRKKAEKAAQAAPQGAVVGAAGARRARDRDRDPGQDVRRPAVLHPVGLDGEHAARLPGLLGRPDPGQQADLRLPRPAPGRHRRLPRPARLGRRADHASRRATRRPLASAASGSSSASSRPTARCSSSGSSPPAGRPSRAIDGGTSMISDNGAERAVPHAARAVRLHLRRPAATSTRLRAGDRAEGPAVGDGRSPQRLGRLPLPLRPGRAPTPPPTPLRPDDQHRAGRRRHRQGVRHRLAAVALAHARHAVDVRERGAARSPSAAVAARASARCWLLVVRRRRRRCGR